MHYDDICAARKYLISARYLVEISEQMPEVQIISMDICENRYC